MYSNNNNFDLNLSPPIEQKRPSINNIIAKKETSNLNIEIQKT